MSIRANHANLGPKRTSLAEFRSKIGALYIARSGGAKSGVSRPPGQSGGKVCRQGFQAPLRGWSRATSKEARPCLDARVLTTPSGRCSRKISETRPPIRHNRPTSDRNLPGLTRRHFPRDAVALGRINEGEEERLVLGAHKGRWMPGMARGEIAFIHGLLTSAANAASMSDARMRGCAGHCSCSLNAVLLGVRNLLDALEAAPMPGVMGAGPCLPQAALSAMARPGERPSGRATAREVGRRRRELARCRAVCVVWWGEGLPRSREGRARSGGRAEVARAYAWWCCVPWRV